MYKIVAGFHTGFVFGRGKNQSCKAHCSWGCLGVGTVSQEVFKM